MEGKKKPQFRIIKGGKGEEKKFNFDEFERDTRDIADPIGPPPEKTKLEKLTREANIEGRKAEKEAEEFRKKLGIGEKPEEIDIGKYNLERFEAKPPKTNLPVKQEKKKEGRFSKIKNWILALLGISAVTAGAVGISAGVAGASQKEGVKEAPETQNSFTEKLKYDPYKSESNSKLSLELEEAYKKLENGELTQKEFLYKIASINDNMIKEKIARAFVKPTSEIEININNVNGEETYGIIIRRKKISFRSIGYWITNT